MAKCLNCGNERAWQVGEVKRLTLKLPASTSATIVAYINRCGECHRDTRALTDAGRQQVELGDSYEEVISGLCPVTGKINAFYY